VVCTAKLKVSTSLPPAHPLRCRPDPQGSSAPTQRNNVSFIPCLPYHRGDLDAALGCVPPTREFHIPLTFFLGSLYHPRSTFTSVYTSITGAWMRLCPSR
jgi:hypothetical protein